MVYTSSFGQCVAREYKVRARSSNTCLSSSDYIFNSNLAQLKFSAGLVIYTTQLDWVHLEAMGTEATAVPWGLC